jgi:hypothetical protein
VEGKVGWSSFDFDNLQTIVKRKTFCTNFGERNILLHKVCLGHALSYDEPKLVSLIGRLGHDGSN